jgi:DNA-binding CsgD family transcriptional regulator
MQIEGLLDHGVSASEIARRLGVAGPTVAYHAKRLAAAEAASGPAATPRELPARAICLHVKTRERVRRLLSQGLSRGEIARELGVSKSTVSYHARRLGAPVDARGARRYDWHAVQLYYDAGHSVRECQAQFGFSRQTWSAAVNRGAVSARPAALPLDELCVAGVHRGRRNLKERLIRSGLKDHACEVCGLREWRGRPLAMELHHVNGDRHDNRIENVQLLCPNCHSQTDNFSGRNRGRALVGGDAQAEAGRLAALVPHRDGHHQRAR